MQTGGPKEQAKAQNQSIGFGNPFCFFKSASLGAANWASCLAKAATWGPFGDPERRSPQAKRVEKREKVADCVRCRSGIKVTFYRIKLIFFAHFHFCSPRSRVQAVPVGSLLAAHSLRLKSNLRAVCLLLRLATLSAQIGGHLVAQSVPLFSITKYTDCSA